MASNKMRCNNNGMPGGKARIEKMLDDVKRDYQGYLRNPF